jgi:CheY-like chemotaxis protein
MTMEEKRILVIDDEENMRHMLALLLEKEGYQVAATIRNLERNNSLLDTGSRHRLVRYDVRGGLQAFSAGKGQQGSR